MKTYMNIGPGSRLVVARCKFVDHYYTAKSAAEERAIESSGTFKAGLLIVVPGSEAPPAVVEPELTLEPEQAGGGTPVGLETKTKAELVKLGTELGLKVSMRESHAELLAAVLGATASSATGDASGAEAGDGGDGETLDPSGETTSGDGETNGTEAAP